MGDVTWLPVDGASFYQVSSDGRIRSIDRMVYNRGINASYQQAGRELKLQIHRNGYLGGRYHRDDRGMATFQVHRLVCAAFHGPMPSPRHEVRHLNGNPQDNRAENLAWGTGSDNSFDQVRHGTHANASKTRCLRDHPLSGDNVIYEYGRRRCLACRRETMRAARARYKQRTEQKAY
jgi:hypothetical protein